MKKIKNNRGVALELAVIMLLTAFGLCTILVTISLKEKSRDRNENKEIASYSALDQIGEDFYSAVLKGNESDFSVSNEEFRSNYSTSNGLRTLSVYDASTNKLLLVVSVDSGNRIVSWKKSQ